MDDEELIATHGKTFYDFLKKGGAWDFRHNKPMFVKKNDNNNNKK